MSTSVGGISFDLTFDGSKMMSQINSFGEKVKNKFSKSFSEAGKNAEKSMKSSNAEIESILNDGTRSAKSKASAIAAIYRKSGLSMSEAMKKAWEQIERDSGKSTKKVKKDINSISVVAKKIGAMVFAAFSVTRLVQFGKECLQLGSDLQEVQNVVDVTFPNMASKINDFSKSAAASFGLSETMAKKYSSTLGSMARSFGFTESQAYDMGTTLTGLAGDVASFYNLSQDEAYTKLKSVFTGETESLKDLGVVMTQSALDAFALANGFGKTTSAMSEAEKVALRYQFVQDKLSAAQGDFARTSDSWANQTKILSLQFESLKATIGQGLIAAFTPVIKTVNTLLQKVQGLATSFKNLMEGIFGAQSSTDAFANAASAAEATAESTGTTASNLKKAQSFLAGFDAITKIPDASESDSSGTSATSGVTTDGTASIGGDEESASSGISKKFEKLAGSFDKFKESVKKLADTIKDGLSWAYENVLKPLAEWTLDEAAPAVLDLFSAAFDVLNSVLEALQPLWQWAWDNFLQPIAKFAGDVFIKFLEGFTDGLTKLSDWISQNSGLIETVTIIISSFFAAWKIADIVDGVKDFLDNLGGIKGAVNIAKTALSALTGAFNPVTVVIAAVIAAGVLLYKNWDKIEEVALDVWESITDAISEAVKKIKEVFGAIVDWFKKKYAAIKDVFANVGEWFGKKFAAALKAVKEAFGSVTSWFKEKYKAVKEVFVNTKDWFGNKFAGALKAVKTAFKPVVSWFKEKYKAIKEVFTNVKDWFSSKFTSAYNAVKKPFESIGKFFSGVYDTVKEKLKSIGTTAGDAIGDSFKKVINSVLKTVEDTINKAIGFINSAIKVINKLPGVNLGTIKDVTLPRLAQGGFVKKNTPQLAVIGDNRHQGEVVAPEDKLAEMAMNAVRMASGNDYSVEILKVLKEILEVLRELDLNIVIDGKKLKDIIVEKINQHTVQTGVCEIII